MKAIHTGDSKRFHRYEIVDDDFVGMVYVPKEKTAPKELSLELLTKSHKDFSKLNAVLIQKKGR